MNTLSDRVQEFEAQGGARGAFERAKVRSERRASELRDILEERGIRIDVGRWLPPPPGQELKLRRYYRTIGVPYGASMEEVKGAYRQKMREHHPDRHVGDPEKERQATRISQDLTIAYDALEEFLKGR